MRRAVHLVMSFMLLCLTGTALANPLLFSWNTPVPYSGTDWSVGFGITLTSGSPMAGPFTVRFHLPDGVEYRSNAVAAWICAVPPAQLREVVCTWTGTLTPTNGVSPHLGIYMRTSPDLALTTHELRATVETPTLPAPAPSQCMASPSSTGCLVTQVQALASSLHVVDWGYGQGTGVDTPGPVATVTSPFEAGNERRVMLQFSQVGYGAGNTPVTARFHLPAGLVYNRLFTSLPGFTCSVAPDGGGQLLTCSTPTLINNGWLVFYVDVAPNVEIPGPLLIHARLGNDSQSVTLAQCLAQPTRMGCGRLSVPTRVARAPRLELVSASASPAAFTRSQEGRVILTYRNAGDMLSPGSRVVAQLPPGLAWNRTMSLSMTCSVSGDPAGAGQLLSCIGPAVPETFTLGPELVLDVRYNAADALPILLAVDMGQGSVQALLDGCAANPQQSHCRLLDVPVAYRCADQHGAEGIFCNGVELLPTP